MRKPNGPLRKALTPEENTKEKFLGAPEGGGQRAEKQENKSEDTIVLHQIELN